MGKRLLELKRLLEPKESQLELMIGHWLASRKACFFKVNVGGFSFKGRFRKQANPYARSGIPDYLVLYKGHCLGLEVKTLKGRQQESQKEFQAYMEKVGKAPYRIVRTLEEAQKAYEDFVLEVDHPLLPEGAA